MSWIPAISNTTFAAIFYVALPSFLFLYLARSLPRKPKLYLGAVYYAIVLGRFAASKFVFYILKWIVAQLFRGGKALAWLGFYVHFFSVGMNFVMQGFVSVLDFFEGLGKVMEEEREERERQAEAEKREARARASAPSGEGSEGQKPQRSRKGRRGSKS